MQSFVFVRKIQELCHINTVLLLEASAQQRCKVRCDVKALLSKPTPASLQGDSHAKDPVICNCVDLLEKLHPTWASSSWPLKDRLLPCSSHSLPILVRTLRSCLGALHYQSLLLDWSFSIQVRASSLKASAKIMDLERFLARVGGAN